MKICIIIPVINEAREISRSIDRACESGADEIVVVDGGSTDGTQDILRDANCVFIESKPGRAIQMNAGAKATRSDVILFLHADNWLAKNACLQIRDAFQNEEIQFDAFEQKIQNEGRVFRWIESGNRWRVARQGLIYGDQAFFIRQDLFEQLGGFPEIPLMEDFELSRRLRVAGKPIILPGPTFVSARRWERVGPIRQTIRNWFLSTAYRLGVSTEWIAKRYRRHDQ